ncbi:hypothetical protein FA95DRAFT_1679403 [Auriscalpium vulgare]|uniref:Uncharacterized protein n=1 Tax=Auriscalpium vulgare TaxID=40419 RepID=A0ACB8RS58_9AGAM|nr:hypothetical protein FA95DRAFT_1679403 [Auriscalpium vulgare]
MLPHSHPRLPSPKAFRRTATSVLAGYCDPRPARDVLTTVLSGVPFDKAVEEQKQERKERAQAKKRTKLAAAARDPREPVAPEAVSAPPHVPPTLVEHHVEASTSWGSRPFFHLATKLRSSSVTPPPMPSSPTTTTGPSISSSHHYDLGSDAGTLAPPHPRKKRPASRKGWKGWVEGSPATPGKLIDFENVKVLKGRHTRSGKSFDGVRNGTSKVLKGRHTRSGKSFDGM